MRVEIRDDDPENELIISNDQLDNYNYIELIFKTGCTTGEIILPINELKVIIDSFYSLREINKGKK